MKRTAIYFYLILIHLALAAAIFQSDLIRKAAYKSGLVPPEKSHYFQKMVRSHERVDAMVPDGATIFIGDSMVQGLATSAVAESSVNFGIGSDTSGGVLARMPAYTSIDRAASVVLMVGVNDIALNIEQSVIVDNYRQILDVIPARVPVLLSAVLPMGDSRSGRNAAIDQLNVGLELLSGGYQNVTYSDAGQALENDSGNLHADFHSDDLHLNTEGYGVIIAHLKNRLSDAHELAPVED